MEKAFAQALEGYGPLFDAALDERAAALAEPPHPPEPPGVSALICHGRQGRWALPLDALCRVDAIPPWCPVPRSPGWILGLAVVQGQRVLLVDTDAMVAGLPPRSPDRPGHVVVMREAAVALAVDRVEEVAALVVAVTPDTPPAMGIGSGGEVLLDAGAVIAAVMAKDGA